MKRILSMVLAVMFSIVLFAGCGADTAKDAVKTEAPKQEVTKTDAKAETKTADAKADSGKKLKFAVVIHDTGNSFFSVMDTASQDAAKQLGVEVKFMGPKSFDVAQQISMIESAIDAGYDGIAYSAPDPKAFDAMYKKAKEKGIPVIAFNTDAPNARDAFVGQDLELSGYQIGKIMFGTYMKGEGKFIITTCQPGHPALEARIAGIKRAMKEFPNVQLVNTIDITGDLTKGYGVIENAYTANKDVKAFIGVDVYAEAIGTFISRNNLTGKVLGGGFDLTPGTLKHIQSGAMQVTIGQNPYLQGYYPIQMLYLMKTKDIKPTDMNTGLEIVSKENVESYLKKKE